MENPRISGVSSGACNRIRDTEASGRRMCKCMGLHVISFNASTVNTTACDLAVILAVEAVLLKYIPSPEYHNTSLTGSGDIHGSTTHASLTAWHADKLGGVLTLQVYRLKVTPWTYVPGTPRCLQPADRLSSPDFTRRSYGRNDTSHACCRKWHIFIQLLRGGAVSPQHILTLIRDLSIRQLSPGALPQPLLDGL